MKNPNVWAAGAIIAAALSMAVMVNTVSRPTPPDPKAEAEAAERARLNADLLLYHESVDELEATAHAKYMSVAELASSLGTDRDHLIGYTFALKKKRVQAEAADRAARMAAAASNPQSP